VCIATVQEKGEKTYLFLTPFLQRATYHLGVMTHNFNQCKKSVSACLLVIQIYILLFKP